MCQQTFTQNIFKLSFVFIKMQPLVHISIPAFKMQSEMSVTINIPMFMRLENAEDPNKE